VFRAFELRALEVAPAVRFYERVLERRFEFEISELPAIARQRGAPPHWLGQLGVDERVRTAFFEAGAVALGPERELRDGRVASVRDPFGAVVGLTDRPAVAARVAWQQHHSTDAELAAAFHSEHFGLRLGTRRELPSVGLVIEFEAPGARGIFVSTARMPHVHSQWLFAHEVADVELARKRVLAESGRALPAFSVPGRSISVCEDAQGAAFLLIGA